MNDPGGNGILSLIPGEYVAAASKRLPSAAMAEQETMQATIEVPRFGSVRFVFHRFKHRHRKSTHQFWTATHAETLVTTSGCGSDDAA
jgi:hypothetical protein